jgi:hypothetical protein
MNYRPERDDPVTFANQVLRDEPWPVAAEIMRAVAEPYAIYETP